MLKDPNPDFQSNRSDEVLLAHQIASIAIVATHYGIGLRDVSLEWTSNLQVRPAGIVPLSEWTDMRNTKNRLRVLLCEKYVTTLLAGSVGRLACVAKWRGWTKHSSGRLRLAVRYVHRAREAETVDEDRALAIYVAWLHRSSRRNPQYDHWSVLWYRALHIVDMPENAAHLDRLVEAILKKRRLSVAEIHLELS